MKENITNYIIDALNHQLKILENEECLSQYKVLLTRDQFIKSGLNCDAPDLWKTIEILINLADYDKSGRRSFTRSDLFVAVRILINALEDSTIWSFVPKNEPDQHTN